MEKVKNLSLSNILSCLALVEQHIERRPVFENYVPNNDFVPQDIFSIQKEASSMMKFVGLQDFTALITFEKTPHNTAGSINLNTDRNVFIDINKELLNRPKSRETILGVLAHEICHKLLYTHGLYMSDTVTNEICTDLATIYVGFGLLTIQGCSSVKSWRDERNNYDGSQTITTHTQTFSTGYLTPKSYMLAYIMMARSYGIKNKDLGIVLDNDILRSAYDYAKSETIRFKKYSKEDIIKQFKRKSKDIAQIQKNIVLLRSMLIYLEKDLVADYKHLDNLNNRIITSEIEKHPIAAMYTMKFDNLNKTKSKFRKNFDKFIDNLFVKTQSSTEYLNSQIRFVYCPICGQKSSRQLEENTVSIRKCKCGRIFLWNAEPYLGRKNIFQKFRMLLKTYIWRH